MSIVMSMASIHKDSLGRSKNWVAAWRGADGRRMQRSTKTTDRKQAQRLADSWETASQKAKAKTFTTAQARTVLNEILEFAGDEPLDDFTVRSWVESWVDGKLTSRGEKTGERYAKPLRGFIESLGKRADLPLKAVTGRDIQRFRDGEKKRGLAVAQVKI